MSTPSKNSKPGERARDEARPDHHAAFAAGEWELSDQRDPDERFGKSRSDGGAPAEQYVRAEGDDDVPDVIEDVEDDDRDPRDAVEPDAPKREAAAEHEGTLESSANPAGMGRGEQPRKAAEREKPNPKPHQDQEQGLDPDVSQALGLRRIAKVRDHRTVIAGSKLAIRDAVHVLVDHRGTRGDVIEAPADVALAHVAPRRPPRE